MSSEEIANNTFGNVMVKVLKAITTYGIALDLVMEVSNIGLGTTND